jgi:hypothetical protein
MKQEKAVLPNIKYLYLSMRDQIDCDMHFYMYSSFDFIEQALKESDGKAKILIHCFKVRNKDI